MNVSGHPMLNLLFHHFIPPSLYGGRTAFPILTAIDRELGQCQRADSVVSFIERSKTDLYGCLRARFATQIAHCTRCEWYQETVNIGSPEIRHYFRAADAAFFDRRSRRILSAW
jgi:hypothetical protein